MVTVVEQEKMKEKKIDPLVTIAIPTYNRANAYLPQALESVFNQTYQNLEIIVADNCSTDETEQVVRAFDDPRLRYVKQPNNIGAFNNWSFCLDQARGAYLQFLFDDDLIDPDFIEVCMTAAGGKGDIGVILTGAREIDEQGRPFWECENLPVGDSVEDFFLGWFANRSPLYLCSTIYNTKGLREVGGFRSKTNMYVDVVSTARLMAKYGRIDVREVKASFRRHRANMGSSSPIREWCEDSVFLLDLLWHSAATKKDLLAKEGNRYFCKRNYTRAARIKAPLRRMQAYWTVYQSFNYVYSPAAFLYQKALGNVKNQTKRLIKQAMA